MDMQHHLGSGFKALYSDYAYYGIDKVRVNCGGAGFSAWSGLPYLFQMYSPNTTYEGDNTVMFVQSSNFLRKLLGDLGKGKKITLPLF